MLINLQLRRRQQKHKIELEKEWRKKLRHWREEMLQTLIMEEALTMSCLTWTTLPLLTEEENLVLAPQLKV